MCHAIRIEGKFSITTNHLAYICSSCFYDNLKIDMQIHFLRFYDQIYCHILRHLLHLLIGISFNVWHKMCFFQGKKWMFIWSKNRYGNLTVRRYLYERKLKMIGRTLVHILLFVEGITICSFFILGSIVKIFDLTSFLLISDQESIVRVPLTKVATDDKPLISETFPLYRIFKNLFLPQGYPDSVSEDYINYQFWDTVQAFCSTINGNFIWSLFQTRSFLIEMISTWFHFFFIIRYTLYTCHPERYRSWQW